MALEAESGLEEQEKRDKVALEAEPETEKPRKKSLRLQGPLYFS